MKTRLRVVAAVLESSQDGVSRVVVELLELVPVGTPEDRTQIRLVEDAPGETERGRAVAIDHVAGDRAGDFVPLDMVLDGGPASTVAGEVARGIGEVDHQAAAILAMGQVPFLVEPPPVIVRCAVRGELAEVAPARGEQPRRVGVFPFGAAAPRKRSSTRRPGSRRGRR